MNKSKWFLSGMAALLLSFGLVLTGCTIDPADVAVTGVSLNKTSLTLAAGAAETLTATVTPNDATNKAVTWASSDTNVATVANGTVTAVAEGTATITVTTADGGFAATCEVTVTVKALSSIAVTTQPTKTAYNQGEALDLGGLVVTATFSDDSTEPVSGWTASPANGTALTTAGTQTVTISYGGKTATCTVTVTGGGDDVTDPTNAATPTINTQPQGASYTTGGQTTALSVSATVGDGGTLSYQWYSNTANSNSGGTLIDGATNSSYTLTVPASGTVYYYVVVTNTNNGATGTKTASVSSNATAITVAVSIPITVEGVTYTLKSVPAGTVTANIGNDPGGPFYNAGTTPVTVDAFSIGETEITYELWKAVYDWATADARGEEKYTFANPGRQGGDDNSGPVGTNQHPVTTISWRDAVVWCNAYSEAAGKTPVYYLEGTTNFSDNTTRVLRESESSSSAIAGNGKAEKAVINANASGFRLPTEAEWEYAARGGVPSTTTPWTYTYAGSDRADSVAVFYGNWKTALVKSKTGGAYNGANSLGLYDMSGNVWEWCWDKYPSSDVFPVIRGGSWSINMLGCTVAYRDGGYHPSDGAEVVGFRVVCNGN